jgi:hypothetical protein
MRLGAPVGSLPPSQDVAAALIAAAGALGQRPAITFHRGGTGQDGTGPDGTRQEQGFASLAGWVAKGAHLLRDEFGLGPGAALGVAAPAGWPLAAVTLAAWWNGITIVPVGDADVTVLHTALADATSLAARTETVLWIGDELDGAGNLPVELTSEHLGEHWIEAVTPFPDRAPAPSHDGTLVAVRTATGSCSQLELLELARTTGDGTFGIDRRADNDLLDSDVTFELLAALAVRPLATGHATVVLDASLDTARRMRVLEEERVRVGPARTA